MNQLANKPPVALRGIALFEILKGVLAVVIAGVVVLLRHTDLHAVMDAFLLRHGFDPEAQYTRLLIETVSKAAHQHVGQIVGLCILYAMVRFLEGYGLWMARSWAEWFAVLSAAIYLPWEFKNLIANPTMVSSGIIIINAVIIIYLSVLLMRQRAKCHCVLVPSPQPLGQPQSATSPARNSFEVVDDKSV